MGGKNGLILFQKSVNLGAKRGPKSVKNCENGGLKRAKRGPKSVKNCENGGAKRGPKSVKN